MTVVPIVLFIWFGWIGRFDCGALCVIVLVVVIIVFGARVVDMYHI